MLTPRNYPYALKRRAELRRRLIAVALVATFLFGIVIPNGVSTAHHTIITGHSTFFNGESHDPCLAAIVGIMRYKVLWFNDMVLVERYNGDGTYLYITESGSDDPTQETLVSSGIFYDFVDPNGVEWHVQEAYWEESYNVEREIADPDKPPASVEPEPGDPNAEANTDKYYVRTQRFYTWIVAVDKPHPDAFADDSSRKFYNFVTLVNTCKFNRDNRNNTLLDDNLTHEEKKNGPHNGHESGEPTHSHESYMVGLWTGGPPTILPAGTETPNVVGGQVGAGGDGDATYDPDSGTYLPRPEEDE